MRRTMLIFGGSSAIVCRSHRKCLLRQIGEEMKSVVCVCLSATLNSNHFLISAKTLCKGSSRYMATFTYTSVDNAPFAPAQNHKKRRAKVNASPVAPSVLLERTTAELFADAEDWFPKCLRMFHCSDARWKLLTEWHRCYQARLQHGSRYMPRLGQPLYLTRCPRPARVPSPPVR